VWGTNDSKTSVAWPEATALNLVWGTRLSAPSEESDNIVWGTMTEEDNVVWGTDCKGADCAGTVWGTRALEESDNIVWGTMAEDDNVVWGTSGDVDSVVWGSSSDDEDNLTWGSSGEDAPMFDDPDVEPVSFDGSVWEDLFGPDVIPVVVPEVLTPLAGGIGGI